MCGILLFFLAATFLFTLLDSYDIIQILGTFF